MTLRSAVRAVCARTSKNAHLLSTFLSFFVPSFVESVLPLKRKEEKKIFPFSWYIILYYTHNIISENAVTCPIVIYIDRIRSVEFRSTLYKISKSYNIVIQPPFPSLFFFFLSIRSFEAITRTISSPLEEECGKSPRPKWKVYTAQKASFDSTSTSTSAKQEKWKDFIDFPCSRSGEHVILPFFRTCNRKIPVFFSNRVSIPVNVFINDPRELWFHKRNQSFERVKRKREWIGSNRILNLIGWS